jgi:hypothetical protein
MDGPTPNEAPFDIYLHDHQDVYIRDAAPPSSERDTIPCPPPDFDYMEFDLLGWDEDDNS